MICSKCNKDNRTDAAYCDGCGTRLFDQPIEPVKEIFVGREPELELLTAGLRDTAEGRGRIMMLCGEPGIGKTRTLQISADVAKKQGFDIFWAHCHEAAGAPPYWPWIQLIRGWLENSSDDQLKHGVGKDGSLIVSLAEDLRERLPNLPVSNLAVSDDAARFRLFDAVSSMWKRACRTRPILLVIDDLQWADTPSLKLLEFIAQEVTNRAIAIFATFRDSELSREHPLSDTLGDLSRRSGFNRVPMTGLNLVESSQLLAIASGKSLSSALVTQLHERTEGNPLFLGEMARYLQNPDNKNPAEAPFWNSHDAVPIPAGIREIIGRRLNQLSNECSQILACAAAIGRRFDLRVLRKLQTAYTQNAIQTLLDEAVTSRLLELGPEQGAYLFSHALIRDTLYQELPTQQRAALHLQIGQALEVIFDQRKEDVISALAHHFASAARQTLDTEKAVHYAELAGRRADSILAFEEAARYYKLALDLLAQANQTPTERSLKLSLAMGESLLRAGESFVALEAFRNASNIAQVIGAVEDFAHAAIMFEEASWRPGIPGHAAVALLESASSALKNHNDLLKAQVLAALSRALIFTGALDEARKVNEQAEQMARELNDAPTLVFTLLAGLAARWGPQRLTTRLTAAREAIELAKQIGDKRLVDLSGWYMFDLMEAGDVAASLKAYDLQSKLAHRLHQPYWLYVGCLYKSTLALFHGNLDQAEEIAIQASEVGTELTGQDVAGVFGLQMFNIRRAQGRLKEVEPLLTEFLKQAPRETTWRPGLAILYAELDRKEEARAEFEALAADDFALIPRDALWPGCLTYLTEICVYLNDRERAKTLYAYLLPHDGYNMVVGAFSACHGSAARLIGMLAAVLKDWDDAERHFQSAIVNETRQDARLWLAHTQYEYARMLRGRGSPDDMEQAQQLLSSALSASRKMGLVSLENRAQATLNELNGNATLANHCAGLSQRETEVLQLVANGLTNKEIAQLLFRSENTIANHIRHILEKTGASNRAEAVAFATREGITGSASNPSLR